MAIAAFMFFVGLSAGGLIVASSASIFHVTEFKKVALPEDGGFTESGVPAKLELNINLLGGVDIIALNAIKDEDVTVRLADGHVHMMSMAFVTEPVPVGDGESKLTIMSNTSEQIS